MTVNYTSLLGLALPATGTEAGAWGDVVNNYLTSYLDASVAGTQTITGSQTAVTLAVTNGATLVTVGSGATGSAQFQIITCTGNPASLLTITAPASSRQYIIINSTSTSQSVKIVGAGPTTGVTIVSGEKAHVAWNGSDFVKIATQNGNGDFVTVDTTNLEVTNIKAKDGTASMTLADSTGIITLSATAGTANGVAYLNGSRALTTGSALTFDGTNLLNDQSTASPIGIRLRNGSTSTAAGTRVAFEFGGTTTGYIGNQFDGGDFNTQYMAAQNHIWYRGVSDAMILTSTGLGLGTNNPAALLHLSSGAGTKAIWGTTRNFTVNRNFQLAVDEYAEGQFTITPSTTLGGTTFTTPVVAINATGNVGIGTNSPQGPLEVAATGATVNQFLTGGTGNNAVTGIFRIGSGAGRGASIQGFRGVSSNAHSLDFYTYNSADVFGMRLGSSGNLGIGETNPTYKLEVNGGASDAMSLFNSTNANGAHLRFAASGTVKSYIGGAPGFLSSGTADDLGIRAVGSILFATAGSGVDMTLDTSGNLGLGVTPSAWASTHKAYQLPGGGGLYNNGADGYLNLANNFYYDGADWRRVTAAPASTYLQSSSGHLWGYVGTGTANSVCGFPSAQMALDTSGNLGLGVTPSAWGSNYRVLDIVQFGTRTASLVGGSGQTGIGLALGVYHNNTNWIATVSSAPVGRYEIDGVGNHSFFTYNGTVTAGATISFTQAMTLDASGRLEIGGTFGLGRTLNVDSATDGYTVSLLQTGAFNSGKLAGTVYSGYYDGGSITDMASIRGGKENTTSGNYAGMLAFYTRPNGGSDTERARISSDGTFRVKGAGTAGSTDAFQVAGAAPADAARITSGGDLLVGQTSGGARLNVTAAASQNGVNIVLPSDNYLGATIHSTATSGDNQFIAFGTEASFTTRGSISYNRAGGLTAYNTTSDYRAKDIISPVANSGAIIDALKVYEGKMKGATQSRPMLVAHEAQEHAPYAVSGVKDEVNEDGTPKYQQMDVSSLVPLLLAEIQSLRARVAQLEQGA